MRDKRSMLGAARTPGQAPQRNCMRYSCIVILVRLFPGRDGPPRIGRPSAPTLHHHTAGPFVFEHEAGRIDGCGACHAPHGSPNHRLLKMWPVRELCLSCHPVTPPSHNMAPFSPFRECATCHTEVHGSNLDPRLFR